MFDQDRTYATPLPATATSGFLPKVYGWMTGGLALTALAAIFTLSSVITSYSIHYTKLYEVFPSGHRVRRARRSE